MGTTFKNFSTWFDNWEYTLAELGFGKQVDSKFIISNEHLIRQPLFAQMAMRACVEAGDHQQSLLTWACPMHTKEPQSLASQLLSLQVHLQQEKLFLHTSSFQAKQKAAMGK